MHASSLKSIRRSSVVLFCFGISGLQVQADVVPVAAPAGQVPSDYRLVFDEGFTGEPESWSENWISDAMAHTHILSSRWPENVQTKDGILRLLNRQEERGGQQWTSGSIGTKQQFLYGYFESRYRYGASSGLNNSFWLMTRNVPKPKVESGEVTLFELDVNEGHYPNGISTNIHRWSPTHTSDSRKLRLGAEPKVSIPLEIPITTKELRIIYRDLGRISIGEIRAFAPNLNGYPSMTDAEYDAVTLGKKNLLLGAKTKASGQLNENYGPEKTVDGILNNGSRWVVGPAAGPHTLTISLSKSTLIGCVQLFNGRRTNEVIEDSPADFTLQYKRGSEWVDMFKSDSQGNSINLSADFHTYGLLWTESEIVFYFDGREIRREANLFAKSPAPVMLSSAVIHWAGPVTAAIDGTSMDVDYVRVWQSTGSPKIKPSSKPRTQ